MDTKVDSEQRYSTCPHDCPSTCALEVEVLGGTRIGKVRGAKDNTYTDGVICAKVARYAERIHHPDRLMHPLQRVGAKGEGQWRQISWEAALDEIAERLIETEIQFGAEAVWPYVYAGTMGLVQRDSVYRLRHAKRYAGQHDTICIMPAWSGFAAGTGKVMGPDPREMAQSDCVVIWGTNAVSTQINVMTHATRARKERGAKIVVIDIYRNDTMKQADLGLCLKPGSDGALACAVMHCLFRDGKADRDYLARYTDVPDEFEQHLASRTPSWASEITGLTVEEIEAFAQLLGERPRAYFRLGYGFTRSRNGAVNMHSASCIPTVLGSWQHEGGGAFHNNADIFGMDSTLIKGLDRLDDDVRVIDQSRIGPALTGDADALRNGPPVKAIFIQNTNPVVVAPEQNLVKQGFAREDLFCVVHEQFMTATAMMADIVLPATMFMEHDDIYRGGGQQHIQLGPKLIDPPGECRSNLYVIEELAARLGIGHLPGFGLTENELIDDLLRRSGRGTLEELRRTKWLDCQPQFEVSHYLNGFGHEDGKFHFKVDWANLPWGTPPKTIGLQGEPANMPSMPDHWNCTENADAAHPFRLATSPSRSFLNTTFNETPGSQKREGRPTVMMHPDDANWLGLKDGDKVRLSNRRGECILHLELFEGLQPGVLIAEGLHPNGAHEGGQGINSLTGSSAIAPNGGAAFHDNKVSVTRL